MRPTPTASTCRPARRTTRSCCSVETGAHSNYQFIHQPAILFRTPRCRQGSIIRTISPRRFVRASGRVRRLAVTTAQADACEDGPWRLTPGAGCASVRLRPVTAGGSCVGSDRQWAPTVWEPVAVASASTMAGRGYLPIRWLPTAHNRWRDRPSSTSMTTVSEQPSRWSKATVYPDMWVDPDDDPRNSGGVSPDGELAMLAGLSVGLSTNASDEVRGPGRRATGSPAGAALDHVTSRPAPPPCRGGARLGQLDHAW
jgi:hypothetical protein